MITLDHAISARPAKPSLCRRVWLSLQALFRPQAIMRRKLPPATVIHGSALARGDHPRRRPF